ncbi:c-type cytochrome [Alphaproteobacteria bacterium]|nr:c-type cytochrome [Alphaproteobacteria bacterium]
MSFVSFSYAKEINSDSILSGGKTTRIDETVNAFSKAAKNLPLQYRSLFKSSNKLFKTDWHNRPNKKFFGIGPTYNATSCISCHVNDGRSIPPDIGKKVSTGLVIMINNFDNNNINYGNKIDTKSIEGVKPEAIVNLKYESYSGFYLDGNHYNLIKPILKIKKYYFGKIKQKIHGRVASSIIGLGLLESISNEAIISWSDPEDKNNDGISGKVNTVYDPVNKKFSVGKFGWKASKASVRHQVVSALYEDMGITNSYFSKNRCPKIQENCNNQRLYNIEEANEKIISDLTFYTSVIAVPARRNINNKIVKKGKKLFIKTGCDKCHLMQVKTGLNQNKKLSFLNNQTIQPFTDLLLHDLGKDLAEHTNEGTAKGNEWRTAPLWGLGLIEKVNGSLRLLHDGRARSIEEAIIWHGGEAKNSKNKFIKMQKHDREALITFLKSL